MSWLSENPKLTKEDEEADKFLRATIESDPLLRTIVETGDSCQTMHMRYAKESRQIWCLDIEVESQGVQIYKRSFPFHLAGDPLKMVAGTDIDSIHHNCTPD